MKEFGDGNIKPSESSWFGFLRELENVTLDNIFVQNPSRCVEFLDFHFKNVCAEVVDAADELFDVIANFTREEDNARSSFGKAISEVTCSGYSVEEENPRSNVSSSENLQIRGAVNELSDFENSKIIILEEHPKVANAFDNDGLDVADIPAKDSFEPLCEVYVVSSSMETKSTTHHENYNMETEVDEIVTDQVVSSGDNVLFATVDHLSTSFFSTDAGIILDEHPKELNTVDNGGLHDSVISSKNDICSSVGIPENDNFEALCEVAYSGDDILFTHVDDPTNFNKVAETAESSLSIEEFEDVDPEELASISNDETQKASYKKKLRTIVSKLNLSKKYLHEFTSWGSASYVTLEKDNIAEEATHPNNPSLALKDSSDFDWEVL
ncbi:hypothetical protein ZOSMA_222G00220 [Zostera marina]|uniref:Uncharacterized protein n=1 Tax=Zostera marina TaxID=29655 RepID=A0A0K9PLH3_ZOSMR|nr:hypothetical protein ZOSMA_222G00220 [Zostera marina]